MAQSTPLATTSRLARSAEIRPATIDDLSSLRYLHTTALRLQAGDWLEPDEIEAFRSRVYSPEYADAVMQAGLRTAWIGHELVASAGWSLEAGEARLRFVFVRPPFAGAGLGRRLVAALEMEARALGTRHFSTEATDNAMGFFSRLGYEAPSHETFLGELGLPVRRMVKAKGAGGTHS